MSSPSATAVAQVRLKPRKAQPFFGRHPWVRDSAIATVAGEPRDGEVVDLVSDSGEWIARGLYNSHSRIRVRLCTWRREESLDEAFWQGRLAMAIALREQLGYDDPAGAARLVYSESDGLSGLIVDRFGEHLVVQPTALAMAERLDTIVSLLAELVQPHSISVRCDETTSKLEGIADCREGIVYGERDDDFVDIREHGVTFRVPLAAGQKTGFYLDQRENRRAAAQFARGRKVLDVCTYTGGFALAAAAAGALHVTAIDSSRAALDLARHNAAVNTLSSVEFCEAEAFDELTRRVANNEQYGVVILDPPKFAAGKKDIEKALRAYHRLNMSAVQLLEPGGILVTCCCSGAVGRQDLLEMLFGVATKSKRDIQVLAQHGAAPDHPVSITCPENAYLKCFICRVV
jgi:23S rRNA (cytosine1962-C5)-methyltransferase